MRNILTFLSCLILASGFAQDTVVIQTLNYDDITKRRDFYVFPDGSETYRKVIMSYSLKCDPRTRQDGYDCGEWDYLTYTYLYDKTGKWDSTYQSGPNFRINGATADNFEYVMDPQYDVYRHKIYDINRDSTISLSRHTVATGSQSLRINNASKRVRMQSLWRASELTGVGLNAGDITGMEMDLSISDTVPYLVQIRMAHSTKDSLEGNWEGNMQQVLFSEGPVNYSGAADIQFHKAFNWNGSDNIVVEFLIEYQTQNDASNAQLDVQTETTSYASSLHTDLTDYYLDFTKNSQQVNLGRVSEMDGSTPKSVEAWVYTREFNNAGIWQAGRRGLTGADFSLRTTTTDNTWRVQHWGTPDYNFNAQSKGEWHHFALTYDGNRSVIYVDGQQVAQEVAQLNSGTWDFIIGRWQGNFFNGKIDEFRVWETALSQNAIQNWMNKEITSQHPNYADLVRYLPLNEGMGDVALDAHSSASYLLENYPWWMAKSASELQIGMRALNERPAVTFQQGVYQSSLDSSYIYDTVMARPMQLMLYNNPASGVQIDPNDPNHPSLVTDTLRVWEANSWTYVYDAISGQKLDSMSSGNGTQITRQNKVWYSPDARFEIGRFITPYGINLTHPQINSAEGYTWNYDVTDYAPLFRDTLELSAGNQQELIDLKFIFIKGTPPRDVLGVKRIWGQNRSYSYRNLDNDVNLSAATLPIDPSAESFKVKTRFTGHGHNSTNGNYPHCCEWKDNEHYLYVDGRMVEAWHVWQYYECAQNPLYPQGGTWPGAREGWCPGDLVKDFDFEIGEHVSGDSVTLDYDITDVPSDNTGMGSGNYQVAMHMITYGAQNFANDAEMLDIISPNDEPYYDRRSLVCGQPIVKIRNNGSSNLTTLNIYYGVQGGQELLYEWKGNLKPNQSEEVELLVEGNWFWTGDQSNIFYARVGEPNGAADQYAANDRLETKIEIPEVITGKVLIQITSNNQPEDNEFYVRSLTGDNILSRASFTANTTYRDTLELNEGCYYFTLIDKSDDGLSYWANSGQGNGSIRIFILDASNRITGVKSFEPEFGNQLRYNFSINRGLGFYPNTGIANHQSVHELNVYPNPVSGQALVELIGIEDAEQLEVLNSSGQMIEQRQISAENYHEERIDLSELPAGIYVVKVQAKDRQYQKRIIKN